MRADGLAPSLRTRWSILNGKAPAPGEPGRGWTPPLEGLL